MLKLRSDFCAIVAILCFVVLPWFLFRVMGMKYNLANLSQALENFDWLLAKSWEIMGSTISKRKHLIIWCWCVDAVNEDSYKNVFSTDWGIFFVTTRCKIFNFQLIIVFFFSSFVDTANKYLMSDGDDL